MMTNDQIRNGWNDWQRTYGLRQRRQPKSRRWALRLFGAFVCLLPLCATKGGTDRLMQESTVVERDLVDATAWGRVILAD